MDGNFDIDKMIKALCEIYAEDGIQLNITYRLKEEKNPRDDTDPAPEARSDD